jgi:DNA-binding FrmR family transcriptional regulator
MACGRIEDHAMAKSSQRATGVVEERPEAEPQAGAHRSHKDVVNRLKRADGHLRNIIQMIEGGRECLDIAQQMHAVIKALENAKIALIHDHIDHCIERVAGPVGRDKRGPLDEFKEITKYL